LTHPGCRSILALIGGVLVLVIILPGLGLTVIQAQAEYFARLGVTAATVLVRDRIVNEIEVSQRLAPTLVLGAGLGIGDRYRAGLETTLTSGGYRSSEAGTETDLGTIRTGSVILGIDGPVAANLRWRGGVGLLGYWPAPAQGIFQQGGTTRFLVAAGLDYRRTILPWWQLMASLRYDLHRFTTDELQARGFSGSQGVRRMSATLGLVRAGP
jgi:hypothetical protein